MSEQCKNPVEALRERAGLGRDEFAMALGVSYPAIYRLEAGHVREVAPEILEALTARGFDAEEIRANYAAWLKQIQDAAGAKLQAVAGR